MTHHPIKILEDGTRVYSNHTRYRPVPDEERRYKRRKPPESDAVRWHGVWLRPLVLQPLEARLMPPTRTDEEAYEHMSKPRPCRCLVCKRPESERWKRKWRKDQLTSG